MKKIIVSICILMGCAAAFFLMGEKELSASNKQGNPGVCKPNPDGKWACVTNYPQKCGSKYHYSGQHKNRDKVVFYPPFQMVNCRTGASKCPPPMMAVDPLQNPYANCANPSDPKNKMVKSGKRQLACCIPKTYLNILDTTF